MKVTIQDISEKSGFSKATVSRVLNDDPHVHEKTRAAIQKVIGKLKYEPNNIARSLSRKKTGIIGVILEDIANPFYTEIAKAVETVLHQAGYSMFLTSSNWIEQKEIELVRKLIQNRVDGILIVPMESEGESLSLIRGNDIPCVLVDASSRDETVSSVSADNFSGGGLACEYLAGTGAENLIIFKGIAHQSATDRIKGVRKTLSKYPALPYRVVPDTNDLTDGYNHMSELIRRGDIKGSTGVFALNDFSAMGIIEALLENGFRVPEDVQVIGYDDIAFARLSRVPLTTVRQPNYKMGEVAAHQLVDLATGKTSSPIKVIFQPQLVVRESCKIAGGSL